MNKVRDIDRGWKKHGLTLRRQALGGPHVLVGVQGPEATAAHAESELTVAEVASYHEFGRGNNPERSFIRETFDIKRLEMGMALRPLASQVVAGKMTARRALEIIGMKAQSDIQGRIEEGIDPPLKESTIKRKKSSKPLIDTGQLKNSITYEVRDV